MEALRIYEMIARENGVVQYMSLDRFICVFSVGIF
jgi:hypothetical protein